MIANGKVGTIVSLHTEVYKDFHKALNVIFEIRKHNLMCAQDMIRILRAKYDKEKRDYIHAVLNNNSIN